MVLFKMRVVEVFSLLHLATLFLTLLILHLRKSFSLLPVAWLFLSYPLAGRSHWEDAFASIVVTKFSVEIFSVFQQKKDQLKFLVNRALQEFLAFSCKAGSCS